MAVVAEMPGAARRKIAWQPAVRFAAFEGLLWAVVYGGYLCVRDVAIGSPGVAQRHAQAVVQLEETLGVAREAAVQRAASALDRVLSLYYLLGFGPLVAGVLMWLGLQHRD